MGNKNYLSINKEQAVKLIEGFLPLINQLNANKRKYCVVGGLGVLLHLMASNSDSLRTTNDIDLMVTDEYLNSDFIKDYFKAYAENSEQYRAIYGALFQGSSIEQFNYSDNELVNTSFIGATEELDNIDTPDVDLVRELNNLSYGDLQVVTIMFRETPIKVASIEDLLKMKERTVSFLVNDLHTSPRPQDLSDRVGLIDILNEATQEIGISTHRIIDDSCQEL